MGELYMDRLRKSAGSNQMGIINPEYKILGSSILSAISVAQIHSLINPSYVQLREQASDPARVAAAKEGLSTSLLIELAAAGLIGYAFESVVPALVAGGLSIGLFAMGTHALETPIGEIE